MPGDQLIGDVIEVVADNLRLRTDPEEVVARTLDQRRAPACRDGAERVPGVAGNETELGGHAQFALDIGVGLRRRLMMPHAVRAETPFKQIDDAAVLELARLNFEQIVGEGEQPKTRSRSLRSAAGTSGYGGMVENFSVSSFLSFR